MPDLTSSILWMGGGFLLAVMLAIVLAGIVQLATASRCLEEGGYARWPATFAIAAVAGLLAASIGAAGSVIVAATAGAVLGMRLVQRRDLTRRPRLVVLLGSATGAAAMLCGFARYLSSSAFADVERAELYIAVFIGALILAASVIAWLGLRGALDVRAAGHPSGMVYLPALTLCVLLGYGFVNTHAYSFGLAVLLEMSVLAAALGAHITMNAADRHPYAFAVPFGQRSQVRCGSVPRRPARMRFEWPDDQWPALLDGDFAPSWPRCAESPDTVRTGAYRQGHGMSEGLAWRYRGRCRGRPRHRAPSQSALRAAPDTRRPGTGTGAAPGRE